MAALATAVGTEVVVGVVVGVGLLVELVLERATRVLVGPEAAFLDGLPPHEANARPKTAQSAAAATPRVGPRFGPADVISPPGAA